MIISSSFTSAHTHNRSLSIMWSYKIFHQIPFINKIFVLGNKKNKIFILFSPSTCLHSKQKSYQPWDSKLLLIPIRNTKLSTILLIGLFYLMSITLQVMLPLPVCSILVTLPITSQVTWKCESYRIRFKGIRDLLY